MSAGISHRSKSRENIHAKKTKELYQYEQLTEQITKTTTRKPTATATATSSPKATTMTPKKTQHLDEIE